jgi:hypothetical protein
MCDIIPGQLIVSYPRDWNINLRGFTEAEYLESIDEKLERHELKLRPSFALSLHLLEIEPGEENHVAAELHAWFSRQRQGPRPQIGPNYLLSVNGSTPNPLSMPSAQSFTFSPDYTAYQSMTSLPSSAAGNPRRILVVDTGIASNHSLTLHSSKNILDPTKSNVDDDNGHGTAVALVINDLAPKHEFIIYKTGDSGGNMNEWDLLAALSADSGADVINLSVEYGLATRSCPTCGRQSSSSRSAVFEKILDSTATWVNRPVIVAAAGNAQTTQLAYPARFADNIAVGSVNSSKSLAQPSNSGSSDHQGNVHQNHFAAPGGDSNTSNPEYVIQLSSGTQYRGTSFACAFASAAVLAAMNSLGTTNFSTILSHLRGHADKSFTNYSSPHHGNGIIRV